jgi:hypothetical protein
MNKRNAHVGGAKVRRPGAPVAGRARKANGSAPRFQERRRGKV